MQQVKECVRMAEALIAAYCTEMTGLAAARQQRTGDELSVERAEIERVYRGMWDNLDSAAAATRAAGRPCDAYDAIRRDPRLDVGVAIGDLQDRLRLAASTLYMTPEAAQQTIQQNDVGLQHAIRAMQALEAAWPDIDWTPPPPPDVDLRPRGLLSRLFGRR